MENNKNEIVLLTPPTAQLDRHLYTTFYAYGLYGLIVHWIESGLQHSADYMAEQLCTILNYYPGAFHLQ